MPILETPRLRLIPATLATLHAELQSPQHLADALGVEVPENWPPDLYDRDAIDFTISNIEQHGADWLLYYFVERAADTAVGCGGYTGSPTPDGTVKLGYSILPQFRRIGYASEATAALVDHAFAHDAIQCVIAETYPELGPSIGVLEKVGFEFAGPGSAERVVRFELQRAAWEQRCQV
jgi:[ribosomal protein S5]-alanine N-acetyltransferase